MLSNKFNSDVTIPRCYMEEIYLIIFAQNSLEPLPIFSFHIDIKTFWGQIKSYLIESFPTVVSVFQVSYIYYSLQIFPTRFEKGGKSLNGHVTPKHLSVAECKFFLGIIIKILKRISVFNVIIGGILITSRLKKHAN